MNDLLGNRMKSYEAFEDRRLMHGVPAFARLDGRGFHNFTRHAERPFDARLHEMFVQVTRFLVEESNALVGYTQSDEITLAWHATDLKSQIFFDGRIQKMASTLAAMASVRFNEFARTVREEMETKDYPHNGGLFWEMRPTFDARVWSVPTIVEAANVFVWRQADAVRNSISMAAHAHFSHHVLQGKSSSEKQEMLHRERGITWNDYPNAFKRGTFVRRTRVERAFTAEEIAVLPEHHEARRNPDVKVERTAYVTENLWLTRLVNREAVLFRGAVPEALAPGRAPTVKEGDVVEVEVRTP